MSTSERHTVVQALMTNDKVKVMLLSQRVSVRIVSYKLLVVKLPFCRLVVSDW